MVEESAVSIVAWPKEGKAVLLHEFNVDKTCPVSLIIEKQVNVNMDMNLKANEVIPVCIKLCEPICAKSEYKISVDLCEKPFMSVTLQGKTMLYGCSEEKAF